MRYKCGVCNVTVPILLVRAHVARHPGKGLEEEEWRSCKVFAQPETLDNSSTNPVHPPAISDTRPAQSVAETRKRKRAKRNGIDQTSVTDCIRKVRKTRLAFERVAMAHKRVNYMAEKWALRRWIKATEK